MKVSNSKCKIQSLKFKVYLRFNAEELNNSKKNVSSFLSCENCSIEKLHSFEF